MATETRDQRRVDDETRTERRADEKVDTARPVETRTQESVAADPYAGIHAARERFGGVDIPAQASSAC
jgi:hypothetical protein